VRDGRAYHEWGYRGPPSWVPWALIVALVFVIVALLVVR
jgi:hypothetical protein